MIILKKLLLYVVIGVAAATFNFLYNYIDDGHRGLMMFFCLASVLLFVMKRRGEE